MQNRLFEITYLLMVQGHATAKELATRYGVSTRTIYRDLDTLSRAGVPVYAQQGRGGGIALLPDFTLDKALFSEEEKRQLLAHANVLASTDVPGSHALAEKLAAQFGAQQNNWLEVDFAPWGSGEAARRLFAQLRDSILQHIVVSFTYASGSGKTTQRTVEPQRLLFRGQSWYVQGWCRERCSIRTFKISRIQNLQITQEHFIPRELPALPPEQPSTMEMVALQMRIKSSSAFRVYDEFGPDDIQQQANGQLLVQASFPAGAWLMGYLLSYGADLEVLAPKEIRTQIIDALQAGLANYL